MNYYSEIKDRLIKNEISKKVREIKNNKSDLTTYYEVGKLLSEAGRHYGEGIIKEYAAKLEKDIGKKYSDRTLRIIRQFYLLFKKQKWQPLAAKLTWSHYLELLPIKDINEINYYIEISINQNLSRNKLRKQDIGQIEIYMNYINENIKKNDQDKTIGIIVCKENDKYIVKYSSDARIYTTTYEIQ